MKKNGNLICFSVIALTAVLLPQMAFAGNSNFAWTQSSNELVDAFSGGWTKNAAVLFTMGAALLLFFGDVSGMTRRLLQGTLAFGIVFNAPDFIDTLFGTASGAVLW